MTNEIVYAHEQTNEIALPSATTTIVAYMSIQVYKNQIDNARCSDDCIAVQLREEKKINN